MDKRSILFIVEGEVREKSFVNKLNKEVLIDKYEILSYNTCIYELYDELSKDEYLDIMLLLREKASSFADIEKLNKSYASIYLIFDFEPHYHKYNIDKLTSMLEFFNDSSDGGKLYVNYPMLESYKHIQLMPDHDFAKSCVHIDLISDYKRLSSEDSYYKHLNQFNYDVFLDLITHHYLKYNIIVYKENSLPTYESYNVLDPAADIKLAKIQAELLENSGYLYILNTSLFYYIELMPKVFFTSRASRFHFKI